MKTITSADEEFDTTGLNPCPCCKSKVDVLRIGTSITMICSKWGCRQIRSKTFEDAAKLWNAPDFRSARK